jgi:hypothetical protein
MSMKAIAVGLSSAILLVVISCGEDPGATVVDAGLPHAEEPSAPPDADAGVPPDADAGVPAPVLAPNTNPCLPFAMPSSATLFASDKKVFAHYFYSFPLSIDNAVSNHDYYDSQYLTPGGENAKWLANGGYLRQRPLPVSPSASPTWKVDNLQKEVKMAIAAGITGFTVDVLGKTQGSPGTQLADVLAAAAAVDSRFKIVAMPDISALGADTAAVESIIASVASSPAASRLPDGRLVISAFDASLGSVAFWTTVFSDLSLRGIKVAFVPTFLGWSGNAAAFAPFSYGFGDWGTATPGAAASSQSWPAASHGYGKIFMMPVDAQQYRPKDFIFWEARNSLAFRNAWTSAIAGGSDWVQLVTWGDFSESSSVEPYTDATLAKDIGTGFYDLNAYYASWFSTGHAPTITEDVLFYFHRREPTGAAAAHQGQPTTAVNGGATDDIELLAFLTAPGTLEIAINGQTSSKDVPAGLTSLSVPLQPGTPRFTLARAGKEVFTFSGKTQIYGDAGLPSGTLDLTYWSGSASAAGMCELTTP